MPRTTAWHARGRRWLGRAAAVAVALGLLAAGLAGEGRGQGVARGARGPCLVSTYSHLGLVIVAAFRTEAEARASAARSGFCALPRDSFFGVAPGVFPVVAASSIYREDALREARKLRPRYKGAYVKFAGPPCPTSGAPATPQTVQRLEEMDSELEARLRVYSRSGVVESIAHPWTFSAQRDSNGVLIRAYGRYNLSRDIRDESFRFTAGKLATADVSQSWDLIDDNFAPPSRAHRYYFVANDCYLRVIDDGGMVCAQACAPGLKEKIVARAALIDVLARARGAALAALREKLSDSWIEDME